MLSGFKNKLNQKRSAAGVGPASTEAARAGSSKNPKKRPREGGNTAHTFRAPGEMPTPPPSRTITRPASPLTNEFNRPIPTEVAMPVAAAQESPLAILGGDRCFTRAMNFNLPPGVEELIGSVPEKDILDGGVEMICRGLMLTCRGAEARRRRVEELSRLEHQLQEASNNLQQAVDANTEYEKKLCWQAAELELDATRLSEVEKADTDKAAEIALLRKALEAVERRGTFLEKEAALERPGKEALKAEVLKTMEDTMVLISQSFDLAVRQTEVLYRGPPPSGQFDQEMEVVDGRLVPAGDDQDLQEADQPIAILDFED